MYVENRGSGVGFRGKINNLGDIKMSSPEGKRKTGEGNVMKVRKDWGVEVKVLMDPERLERVKIR